MYLILHPDFAPVLSRSFALENWHEKLTVIDLSVEPPVWYDGDVWHKVEKRDDILFLSL